MQIGTMKTARLIASAFGCGYTPHVAGTIGSFVALLLGAAMLHVSPTFLPVAAFIATLAGVQSLHVLQIDDDPSWVVIDEVAGQWLALCGLAHATLPGLFAAFLIFRLLDISKPGPIGWADRQHGAAGIMADDVIAGAITAGILWAIRSHWPGLLD